MKKIRHKILFAAVLLAVTASLLAGCGSAPQSGGQNTAVSAVNAAGDLVIDKKQITEKASFFSYDAGGTKMEVIAVKAADGSIRTAFNTCQVCYDSGRGYYKLDGNTFVCQNCGNRFSPDQVEMQKGGCNPVGITKEYKQEDANQITIPKSFFEKTKSVFANWKA